MGVSKDREGTDRRRKRPNLLQEVKEASLKGSWQDVLSAMEEATSRGLRLNGRCSDLGAGGIGEGGSSAFLSYFIISFHSLECNPLDDFHRSAVCPT